MARQEVDYLEDNISRTVIPGYSGIFYEKKNGICIVCAYGLTSNISSYVLPDGMNTDGRYLTAKGTYGESALVVNNKILSTANVSVSVPLYAVITYPAK